MRSASPLLKPRLDLQECRGVVPVNFLQHIARKPNAVESGVFGRAVRFRIIRVGNRARTAPRAFPECALTPVSTDIMLALEAVTRDEIGAKKEAFGKAFDQLSDCLAPRRRFAYLPFGGAGVE